MTEIRKLRSILRLSSLDALQPAVTLQGSGSTSGWQQGCLLPGSMCCLQGSDGNPRAAGQCDPGRSRTAMPKGISPALPAAYPKILAPFLVSKASKTTAACVGQVPPLPGQPGHENTGSGFFYDRSPLLPALPWCFPCRAERPPGWLLSQAAWAKGLQKDEPSGAGAI